MKLYIRKHKPKKHLFILFQVEDFDISDIFKKNQKPKVLIGFLVTPNPPQNPLGYQPLFSIFFLTDYFLLCLIWLILEDPFPLVINKINWTKTSPPPLLLPPLQISYFFTPHPVWFTRPLFKTAQYKLFFFHYWNLTIYHLIFLCVFPPPIKKNIHTNNHLIFATPSEK